MGSLKAWLQGATIRNTKPGKIQHFGGNFNSYIVLDETIMVPYGVIRGKFLLESNFHPKITGLRVQLEAECILRLTTTGKNGRLVHRKKVCVLENTEIDDKGDLLSPIRHNVLKPTDADHVYVIASLGRNGTTSGYSTIFPPIPGVTLPAPFKNPYGSLVYKVVGYLRSYYCRYVPVAEETVQFTGYHNLSQKRSAQRPINIERPFNGADGLYTTAILSAETSGYLPGEDLQFLLILECNRCVPIVMKVFLSQKISYNVDGVIKNLFTTIDFKQKEDAIEISKEIIWQDVLTLPKNLDPSYSHHPAYTVKYAIRFKLHIGTHGTLEGAAPLYVGTTREPVESVMISGTASTVAEPTNEERLEAEGAAAAPPNRSGSPVSVRSDNSVTVGRKMSLPTYSQLSSRAVSLETLPPAYSEVVPESDSE